MMRDTPTPLDALTQRARRDPDAVALIAGDAVWTSGKLVAEADRIAGSLERLGVRCGDRIALHALNRVEAVLTFLAGWRIGAVVAPQNVRFKGPELAVALQRIAPSCLVGDAELLSVVDQVPDEILARRRRFVIAADRGGPSGTWEDLASSDRSNPAEMRSDAQDRPAVLLATSGTTGTSKLVLWTDRTLAALAGPAADRGFGPDDVFPMNHPLAHSGGVTSTFSCILTGGVPVLMPRFDPDDMLDVIEARRCTALIGLPFMCAELARRQTESPRDTSSLRRALTGGDRCSTQTETAFQTAFGVPLRSFWAATEDVSAMLAGNEAGPSFRPAPGTEVRLEPPGSNAADGTGEMLVRSPGTSPGYWSLEEGLTSMPDGWFRTGDVVERGPDDQLHYVGRLKDLIIRGGSNVSPAEVEEALRAQPDVVDAAVCGLPDAELGERIAAAIVVRDGCGEAAAIAAIAGLGSTLSDYKVPERFVLADAIPRNSATKVDREAVRLLVDAGGRAIPHSH